MTLVRSTLKIALLIAVIMLAVLVYYCCVSERAIKAAQHVKHSEEIKKGMHLSQVIKIMGTPDKIFPAYHDSTESIYFYEPALIGASAGIDVYIDSTEHVKRITLFE